MPFISYSYSTSNDCWRSTFCCLQFNPYNSWARFNNLCFRGCRGWDQQFMRTSKSIPRNPYTTHGWYIYHVEKKTAIYTENGVLEYVAFSPRHTHPSATQRVSVTTIAAQCDNLGWGSGQPGLRNWVKPWNICQCGWNCFYVWDLDKFCRNNALPGV